MSRIEDVQDDVVIDCIDDEEVEDGNDVSCIESTVSHSASADGPRLIIAPIVSEPASTESPAGVNNLNSPIVAPVEDVVPNSGLDEEKEHFPISNA